MEGGVGDFTANLADALVQKGHDVHILTDRRAKRPEVREPSQTVGEAFQRLGNVWEPQDIEYGKLHARFRRWNWGEMSTVADIAIRHELDLVNIQYQAAAFNMRNPAINFLPARVNSILKTVATFHDLRVPYLFPKAGGLRKRVVYRLAGKAHGTIVTNPANQEELKVQNITSQMIPIGNNIPAQHVNHIEIEDNRKKIGLGENDVLLGYFGFFNESKGGSDLIELLQNLDSRYHLVVIGGGVGDSDSQNNQDYKDSIQVEIESYGLSNRVHWTGYLAENRVSAWMKTADIMVLPYKDGVSTRRGSLMAALAHGRPIVSTHADIINPLLQDNENMLLVETGNMANMKSKVELLAADAPLRERLSAAAQATSEAFSWPEIADRTIAYYRSVLDQK